MSCVLGRQPLPRKYMPQVPAAPVTQDLHPTTIRVRLPTDRSRYLVVKGRPSTTGFELVLRSVQRRVTSPALVHAFLEMPVVFTAEWIFRTLPLNYICLFRCQGIPFFCLFHLPSVSGLWKTDVLDSFLMADSFSPDPQWPPWPRMAPPPPAFLVSSFLFSPFPCQ